MASITIRNVPEEVKRQFYAACVARGVTMSACLMKYVYQEIEADRDCSDGETEHPKGTDNEVAAR